MRINVKHIGKKLGMDNQEILRIAIKQSALDCNAKEEDFVSSENVLTDLKFSEKIRKYYSEPISCILVSYGNGTVASVKEDCRDIMEEYLSRFTTYKCFETPAIHWLDERLEPLGQKTCYMAEYWLPDIERVEILPCRYETKLLTAADFQELYLPEWSNALCEKRKELDVLGVGAYDNGVLIGLAACSADCDTMWQIGIDVLPAYRRQGIASALTSRLTAEILKRDKVPFYCCAWSNIASARNAIRSGFQPAWTEISVKTLEYVKECNA